MIEFLSGNLIAKSSDRCVIDVNGVGYGVSVSLSTLATLPQIGEPAKLNIHTHVREDQLMLYGFASTDEKVLFEKLIAVSGVGPKTALAILSGIPVPQLVNAISQEDKLRLSTIPGIGKKTAERIIIELKDRLAKGFSMNLGGTVTCTQGYEDALSALMNLGYQRMIAESALKKVGFKESMPLEDAIRSALKELCRA